MRVPFTGVHGGRGQGQGLGYRTETVAYLAGFSPPEVVLLVEDLLSSGGETGLLQPEIGELEFLREQDVAGNRRHRIVSA